MEALSKIPPKPNRKKIEPFVRDKIAHNQQYRCVGQECKGEKLLPPGFELDHIIALCNGGKDEFNNLQALCPTCHRIKTKYDMNPNLYERMTGNSKFFGDGPLSQSLAFLDTFKYNQKDTGK